MFCGTSVRLSRRAAHDKIGHFNRLCDEQAVSRSVEQATKKNYEKKTDDKQGWHSKCILDKNSSILLICGWF